MVLFSPPYVQDTRLRSWLLYCATSRKVAGSIHWNFSFTWALESSLFLTEMITWVICWGGYGGRCLRLTNLSPSCAYFLEILATSTSCPKGLSSPVEGFTPQSLYTDAGVWSYAFCRMYAFMACTVQWRLCLSYCSTIRKKYRMLSLQLEHGIRKYLVVFWYVDGKVVMKHN